MEEVPRGIPPAEARRHESGHTPRHARILLSRPAGRQAFASKTCEIAVSVRA